MHDRRFAALILGALLVLLLGSTSSVARLTSSDGTNPQGAAPGASSKPDPAASEVVDGINMAPGDLAIRTVTVARLDPSARRYRVRVLTAPPGNPLAAQLILTVTTVGSSCERSDGRLLFSGRATEIVIPARADGLDAESGALCLRVELPLEVGDTPQGTEVWVQLTVTED
jgi:hypothetical protein